VLTMFTTCKPFRGLAATHQRNALKSWTRLEPRPDVLVFGDEEGVADACTSLGLTHVPTAPVDENGLPVLNFLFAAAQAFSRREFLCYANSDLVMLGGLAEAAERLGDEFPSGFLGVCRRWDADLDEPLDFGDDWRALVRARVEDGGELYTPCSSDLFLFRKPLAWHLPPFVAGRPGWDNWMLWAACQNAVPVVDLSEALTVAHPRHGYGDGEGQKAWRRHPSGERNRKLAAGKEWCLNQVRRRGMLWRMVANGKIEKT
jgi:hypothetical protein